MKWSKKKAHSPKKEPYYRTAKKKHYRAICNSFYVGNDEYFYYTINRQDYEYNSFTHGDVYKSEDECMAAAEKHIDKMSAKSNVNVNKEAFLNVIESTLGKEMREWVSQKFLR